MRIPESLVKTGLKTYTREKKSPRQHQHHLERVTASLGSRCEIGGTCKNSTQDEKNTSTYASPSSSDSLSLGRRFAFLAGAFFESLFLGGGDADCSLLWLSEPSSSDSPPARARSSSSMSDMAARCDRGQEPRRSGRGASFWGKRRKRGCAKANGYCWSRQSSMRAESTQAIDSVCAPGYGSELAT